MHVLGTKIESSIPPQEGGIFDSPAHVLETDGIVKRYDQILVDSRRARATLGRILPLGRPDLLEADQQLIGELVRFGGHREEMDEVDYTTVAVRQDLKDAASRETDQGYVVRDYAEALISRCAEVVGCTGGSTFTLNETPYQIVGSDYRRGPPHLVRHDPVVSEEVHFTDAALKRYTVGETERRHAGTEDYRQLAVDCIREMVPLEPIVQCPPDVVSISLVVVRV